MNEDLPHTYPHPRFVFATLQTGVGVVLTARPKSVLVDMGPHRGRLVETEFRSSSYDLHLPGDTPETERVVGKPIMLTLSRHGFIERAGEPRYAAGKAKIWDWIITDAGRAWLEANVVAA